MCALLALDDDRAGQPLAQLEDLRLEERLLVLGVVVLGVLLEVAEVTRDLDPLRDLLAARVLEVLELSLQVGEALRCDLGRLGAHLPLTVAMSFVSLGPLRTRSPPPATAAIPPFLLSLRPPVRPFIAFEKSRSCPTRSTSSTP